MRVKVSDRTCRVAMIEEYQKIHGCSEIVLVDVVEWAMRTRGLTLPHDDVVDVLVAQFSEAIRQVKLKVPGGTSVRAYHPVMKRVPTSDGFKQLAFWVHMYEAPRSTMKTSFQQRLKGINDDVAALKADLDHYNKWLRSKGKRPIQLSFDFS